eukprot:352838-Chlamydomonas_euryale.AAC.1
MASGVQLGSGGLAAAVRGTLAEGFRVRGSPAAGETQHAGGGGGATAATTSAPHQRQTAAPPLRPGTDRALAQLHDHVEQLGAVCAALQRLHVLLDEACVPLALHLRHADLQDRLLLRREALLHVALHAAQQEGAQNLREGVCGRCGGWVQLWLVWGTGSGAGGNRVACRCGRGSGAGAVGKAWCTSVRGAGPKGRRGFGQVVWAWEWGWSGRESVVHQRKGRRTEGTKGFWAGCVGVNA